jgi:hypothetical protein
MSNENLRGLPSYSGITEALQAINSTLSDITSPAPDVIEDVVLAHTGHFDELTRDRIFDFVQNMMVAGEELAEGLREDLTEAA